MPLHVSFATEQFQAGGCCINVHTMRFMIVGALEEAGKGEMLSPHLTAIDGAHDRSKFCASSFWLRTFLRKYLQWTWRASTAAAQGTPPNAHTLIDDMLLRIAYLCRAHNVPPDRFFMADETFAHLTPNRRFTYAPVGSKEVHVAGMQDKAGVTVMVTLPAAGTMLPMQAITKGATQQSLRKFTDGSGFTQVGGGFQAEAKSGKAKSAVRKTCTDDGKLGEHPPYYQDPDTGHMIVAGMFKHTHLPFCQVN